MFDDLPPDFPKLQLAAATIGHWGLGSPPDMKSLGERVRAVFLSTLPADWPHIRRSYWKNLPYAFWLNGTETFAHLPELLEMYFSVRLADAAKNPRMLKRWAKPLIFAYAAQFKPNSTLILRMAKALKGFADKELSSTGSPLSDLQNQFSFFSPQYVGDRMSKLLLEHSDAHAAQSDWLQRAGLWPTFMQSDLAIHAHHCAINFMRNSIGVEANSKVLISWGMAAGEYKKLAPLPMFTEALLLPWRNVSPSKALQEQIINLYTTNLTREDPRLNAGHWPHTDPVAKATLMRWIAADSLDLFFKILSQTAEPMWEYRHKFWQALMTKNAIDEVWPVLGHRAAEIAKRSDIKFKQYAALNGASSEQSVLLMRMGDLVFAEWTHSGSLRVAESNSIQAPQLYKHKYLGPDLRFRSLPFEADSGEDGLRHMGAEYGSWQRKAADFIRQKTGVNLRSSDYL